MGKRSTEVPPSHPLLEDGAQGRGGSGPSHLDVNGNISARVQLLLVGSVPNICATLSCCCNDSESVNVKAFPLRPWELSAQRLKRCANGGSALPHLSCSELCEQQQEILRGRSPEQPCSSLPDVPALQQSPASATATPSGSDNLGSPRSPPHTATCRASRKQERPDPLALFACHKPAISQQRTSSSHVIPPPVGSGDQTHPELVPSSIAVVSVLAAGGRGWYTAPQTA